METFAEQWLRAMCSPQEKAIRLEFILGMVALENWLAEIADKD